MRDAKFEHRPQGALIVDGIEIAHTRQCCHCGQHFVSVRGSGMRRGFCMRCMKITCGASACDPCIPAEAKLEHAEGKRNRYTDLIIEAGG